MQERLLGRRALRLLQVELQAEQARRQADELSKENKELLEAATYGNVSGVHVLVQLGADVNYRELDPDFYYTPLIMASSNDETRAMEALLALKRLNWFVKN